MAVRQDGDAGGDCLDIGNDVSRKDDNALTGKFRQKIAEADSLLGIQASRWFIHDQKLRIVK